MDLIRRIEPVTRERTTYQFSLGRNDPAGIYKVTVNRTQGSTIIFRGANHYTYTKDPDGEIEIDVNTPAKGTIFIVNKKVAHLPDSKKLDIRAKIRVRTFNCSFRGGENLDDTVNSYCTFNYEDWKWNSLESHPLIPT